MKSSTSRLLGVSLTICAGSLGAAEVEVLTLRAAVDRALTQSPSLLVHRADSAVAAGRIEQAGLRTNPELLLQSENFAGTGALAGSNALETTLVLSQVLDLGGVRSRGMSVAQAQASMLTTEQTAQRLDLAAATTRAFIDVVAAREKLSLAGAAEALALATVESVDQRLKAGRLGEVELTRALMARTRAALDRSRAEQALNASRLQLAALWGDTRADFDVDGDLFAEPPLAEVEALLARLEANPELGRLTAEVRVHDAELQLAQAQARTQPTVSAGMRQFEQTGDTAFVAGVSLPLRLFDRNQGQLAVARATVDGTQARRQAFLAQVRVAVTALHQELRLARREAATLRNETVPQARRVSDEIEAGYLRGRYSHLELTTARRELLDAQRDAIDSAAGAHRLLADLERLTGQTAIGRTGARS